MPIADEAVRDDEANVLFGGLENLPGFIVAVSGGPDSTALLLLAARWAKRLRRAPKLVAVTVDHGLRPAARREAAAVKRLARRLGVPHRTLRWRGRKPKTGLQEAARLARYGLLADAARRSGFACIVTAHTLDDQAETVLFRLARGSGVSGLAGIARVAPSPHLMDGRSERITLVRPLLHVAKARLLATLKAARIACADDPSNRDPRFTRTRLRTLMPALAGEGLDARCLARLASRVRRAEYSIEFVVDVACRALAPPPWTARGSIVIDAERFATLPAEIALRLLGRTIVHVGREGRLELAKLEMLYDSLRQSPGRLRRTLAGALISLGNGRLTVEIAPARRFPAARDHRNRRFTKSP